MKYIFLLFLFIFSCEKEPLPQCEHLSCKAYYIHKPEINQVGSDTLFFSTTSCDLPLIEQTFDKNIKCDCEPIN